MYNMQVIITYNDKTELDFFLKYLLWKYKNIFM